MAAAQWQVAALLCAVWSLTLLYGEWLQYLLHAPLCRDLLPHRSEVRRMDRSKMSGHFTVAVLSNPQLVVSSSRALLPYQIRSDLQLRRRFRSSILSRASPNEVIILGDLFSRPLPLRSKEWETSISRYKHIFDPVVRHHGPRRSLKRNKQRIPRVVQIPGPIDVMRRPDTLAVDDEYFAELSHAFSLDLNFVESVDGAFNLFGLNSAAADGNKSSHHTKTFWSFVDQAASHAQGDSSSTQNIVLTPIPIFSPLGAPCFSLRHSYWVQTQIYTEISKSSTARLVSTLRPTFSISGGHEGETCWQAIKAPSSSKDSTAAKANITGFQGGQIMLGSFNPQRAYASAPFLLLSAPPPPPPPTSKDNSSTKAAPASRLHMQLCITPPQYGLVGWYYLLAVASVLALVLTPVRGPSPFEEIQKGIDDIRSQLKRAKVKTENGETAYVEVLDAEGNLLTVPLIEAEKPTSVGATNAKGGLASQGGPHHRGKHHLQSQASDVEQGKPQGKGKEDTAPASEKSTGSGFFPSFSVLRSRLFGAAGPLAALLAVQLALYLSMLASDWA